MYDMAKKARAAMKSKAQKMGGTDPHTKVDSSTWTPPEPLNAEVKTGLRPISRRAFKSGGKVHGEKAPCNMGRKPRKSGGKAITANSLINRDVKDANDERDGKKHVGGYKRGGKPVRKKRESGGGLQDLLTSNILKGDSIFSTQGLMNKLGLKRGGKAKRHGYATDGKVDEIGEYLKENPAPAPERPIPQPKNPPMPPRRPGSFYPYKPESDEPAPPSRPLRKSGGRSEKHHDDVKADKALIRKMVKPEARTGKKAGGKRVGKFGGGAMMGGPQAMGGGAPMGGGMVGGMGGGAPPMNNNPPALGVFTGMAPGITGNTGPNALGGMGMHPGMGGMSMHPLMGGIGGMGMHPGMGGAPAGVTPGGPATAPMARKTGGRTGKGHTHVNVIVGAGRPAHGPDMMGAPGPMGGPTPPPPVPVPTPMGGAPGMPPGMPPVGGPAMGGLPGMPPMGRKSGGRTYRSYKDLDAGSGSGEGRLEKEEIQRHKRK